MRQRTLNNKQLSLYVILLIIAVALMASLRHCGTTANAHGAQHSGGDTIDIAIEYSPATYYSFDDTLGGFNYDLLRMMSCMVARAVKFHPFVTLSKALADLDEGIVDVVVGQFPLTAENRERYLFTDPIYIDRQVLVQRADSSALHSQLDLGGDTVHVVKNSPMAERIASLGREIGDTIYVISEETYGPEQLVMMVASGEIKRAVVNCQIATAVAARLKNIDTSVAISLSQFQPWVLRHDHAALCDSINAWHKRVTITSDYNRLYHRYFPD